MHTLRSKLKTYDLQYPSMHETGTSHLSNLDRSTGQLYIFLSYKTHFSFHIIRNISFGILNNVRNHVRRARHTCQPYLSRIRTKTSPRIFFPPVSNRLE